LQVNIDGIQFKELSTLPDQRGFFREIIRVNDDPFFKEGFGQWSHSMMFDKVIKAWHYH
jgi:dTDP-4-dehydrorhamnose 3,5-epimerase